MPVPRAVLGALLLTSGMGIGLLHDPTQENSKRLAIKDDEGRERFVAEMRSDGIVELALHDKSRPRLILAVHVDGTGALEMFDSSGAICCSLGSDAEGKVALLLRKRDGASVRFGLEAEAITTDIMDPSGSRVISLASGRKDQTTVMLRPPSDSPDGSRRWLSLQVEKDGAGIFFGNGDKTALEIKEGKGLSGLIVGDYEKGPGIALTSRPQLGSSIVMTDPEGNPSVFLQNMPGHGSLLSLGGKDENGPRVTLGVDAQGGVAHKVTGRNGRVLLEIKE